MDLSAYPSVRQKQTSRAYILAIGAVLLFYAAVLTPLEKVFTSDISIMTTVLPICWDFLMTVVNYLFYWISFAFLIYSICTFSLRGSIPFFVIYGVAVLLRYPVTQLAVYLVMGFESTEDFLDFTLPYLISDIVLDLVQLACATLIAKFLLPRRADGIGRMMPFTRLLPFSNRLQLVSALTVMIPSVIMLITRLIFDLTTYGMARDFADFLWMAVYYLTDLLSIAAGYLVVLLILGKMERADRKLLDEFAKKGSVL